MESELISKEQNHHLTAAYMKMNEEGRDVLDMVIKKLAESRLGLEDIKKGSILSGVIEQFSSV